MSQVIEHRTASQRRHYRVNAPIDMRIDGVDYETVNWSVIDFKIKDYHGSLSVGEEMRIELNVPYQGFEVRFSVSAQVVKVDSADHTLVGEFVHVDERQREILETFVAGLIRGEMESFEGIIRRMDLPVTPVSLKPDLPLTPEEIEVQEKRRRVGGLFYLSAGILFSMTLLVIMYTNLFQIKVDNAVMAAPTDIILAPATGIVKEFVVTGAEHPKKGDLLVIFEDPQLEQDIARARLKLEEVKSSASTLPGDTLKKEKEAVATIAALEKTVTLKENTYHRLRELLQKGLTRKDQVDKAEAELYKAQSELSAARQKGADKQSLLSIAQGEYDLLLAQRDRLTLHAPKKGRLISRLVPKGTTVRYGDPVAVFQHDEPKYVEAFLTREEAIQVKPGTTARVHFPPYGYTAEYTVKELDYASRLITRRDGRYVLDGSGVTRDVLVRLMPINKQDEILPRIDPGTSAVVIFPRSPLGG